MDIIKTIAEELNITPKQAENTVKLIDEGNTIPFIARYRKEVTGSLNDEVLRKLNDRLNYLRALDSRKEEILRLIDEQGKLDSELEDKINKATMLQELEDLYRPYRPKRRTRATVAKEKGLEPFALEILDSTQTFGDVYDEAKKYLNEDLGVLTPQDAIDGAKDIIAEILSDDAQLRKKIRSIIFNHGFVISKNAKDEDSVYSMYYDFAQPVKAVAPHRVLAMDRGEKEEFLKVSVKADEQTILDYINSVVQRGSIYDDILKDAATDSYRRLIEPSLEREIRNTLTENAGEKAIGLFSKNLYQLLMQPPIKNVNVLGVDPGYRTGCKIAVVDETGRVCDTDVIFCTLEHHDKEKSTRIVKDLITKYNVGLVSIGNGTASKETEIFIADVLKQLDRKVYYIMTNEAGASVYSASKLASEEFPDFTVEQRSAASIARRVQDPLAELVKIDPKSIGVGQYQHDMNQKRLSEALSGVVENCVNSVGVDLNTASAPLLSYIAGLSSQVAKNIVKYREVNGKFKNRKQLLKVEKLGPKAFEQSAGFLRISGGEEILDSTSVHPESYTAAMDLISQAGFTPDDVKNRNISGLRERAKVVDMKSFCEAHNIGMPTVNDIIDALLKPGLDIRDDMPKPVLMTDILSIDDLKPGMVLTGTVRNVIDFGAFVDIGVHQDGLVHISQISDKYIKHPTDVLNVGDVIKVKVLEVNTEKKKISLSIKEV